MELLNHDDSYVVYACCTIWVVRAILDPSGATRDFQLTLAIMAFTRFDTMLQLAHYAISKLEYRSLAILLGPFLVTSMLWSFYIHRKRQAVDVDASNNSIELAPGHPLKPLLFPCRTAHTRLFPKKHSFSYSYLFVGVPVGWAGSAGSMVATGTEDVSGNVPGSFAAWFRVNARDHLDRGKAHIGLRGKLRVYLESQVC